MSEAAATGLAAIEPTHLAVIRRWAILSCAIGNFFELFDFTIYGYFAVTITRAFIRPDRCMAPMRHLVQRS
jgi:hypothetical protein